MHEQTLPQAAPPASTGTQAATPDQLKRSAELSANSSGDAPRSLTERYELREQLAKGGMGTVHSAWDKTFDRAVAIKLIHDHLLDEHAIKRFRHEARIAGQLQHPNIPPVYDLGLFDVPTAESSADKSGHSMAKPYLAMKLVKGRTLDDHIKHPGGDTPNLVAVFEAIAQAIGYAHSRGVLHRDLKPQNVMVGAFGEVQVMDWGLAKVKSDDQPEPSGGRPPSEATELAADPDATTGYGTRIGSPDDTRTTAGSVLGTPAYMPPEQARGDLDQITERSDVFGLGAILCTILTGHSVFGGGSAEQARRKSAAGDVADAFARLDANSAEPELIALAKKCLAPDAADRFSNGTEVANATARIRAESEARAKQAELNRVRVEGALAIAKAEAREQRKRRRVQLALAILLVVTSISGIAYLQREERREHEAIVEKTNRESNTRLEINEAFASFERNTENGIADAVNPPKWRSKISTARTELKRIDNSLKVIDSQSELMIRYQDSLNRLIQDESDCTIAEMCESWITQIDKLTGNFSVAEAQVREFEHRVLDIINKVPVEGDQRTPQAVANAILKSRMRDSLVIVLFMSALISESVSDRPSLLSSVLSELKRNPPNYALRIREAIRSNRLAKYLSEGEGLRLSSRELLAAPYYFLGDKSIEAGSEDILQIIRDRNPADAMALLPYLGRSSGGLFLKEDSKTGITFLAFRNLKPVGLQVRSIQRLRAADTAAAFRPDLAMAFYAVGQSLSEGGYHDLAAESFKKYVTIEPRDQFAKVDLADALDASGQFVGAAKIYRELLTHKSNYDLTTRSPFAEVGMPILSLRFAAARSALMVGFAKMNERGNAAAAEAEEYRNLARKWLNESLIEESIVEARKFGAVSHDFTKTSEKISLFLACRDPGYALLRDSKLRASITVAEEQSWTALWGQIRAKAVNSKIKYRMIGDDVDFAP